jgi:hypothetical protein
VYCTRRVSVQTWSWESWPRYSPPCPTFKKEETDSSITLVFRVSQAKNYCCFFSCRSHAMCSRSLLQCLRVHHQVQKTRLSAALMRTSVVISYRWMLLRLTCWWSCFHPTNITEHNLNLHDQFCLGGSSCNTRRETHHACLYKLIRPCDMFLWTCEQFTNPFCCKWLLLNYCMSE